MHSFTHTRGSEHGNGGRSELTHQQSIETVDTIGISNVGCPVLNGTLASDKGQNVVAEHGEHGQPSVPDLLDLQLSEGVGIISQTQRVDGITRVQVVQTLQTLREYLWLASPPLAAVPAANASPSHRH